MKNNHEIILKQYAAYCKEQPLYLGTAGSYGMEMLTIIREGVWAEYDILAAFHPPVGAAVQVRVGANNQIGVPIEATAEKGMGEIVFAGYKEGVRQIAVDVLYKVAPSSGASGTEPAEPTPDVVQQIMLAANAAEKLAQSVRDDADVGKFTGAKGDKGDIGPTGPKGERGEKGDPGKDAVIDTTLTHAGEAADAAEVGKLKEDLGNLDDTVFNVTQEFTDCTSDATILSDKFVCMFAGTDKSLLIDINDGKNVCDCYVISVDENDKFQVKGCVYNDNLYYPLIVMSGASFTNNSIEQGSLVTAENGNYSYWGTGNETGIYEFVIPKGVKTLFVNKFAGESEFLLKKYVDVKKSKIPTKISELENDTLFLSNEMYAPEYNIYTGQIRGSDDYLPVYEVKDDGAYQVTEMIPVSKGDKIYYSGNFYSHPAVALYDKLGAYVSDLSKSLKLYVTYNDVEVGEATCDGFVAAYSYKIVSGNYVKLALNVYGNKAKNEVKSCYRMNYLYVATTGNDESGDGSANNPFASIYHANEIIHSNSPRNRFTIIVKNGTYTDLQERYSGIGSSGVYQGVKTKPYVYYQSETPERPDLCVIKWNGATGLTIPCALSDVNDKAPFHVCGELLPFCMHTKIRGFTFDCKNTRYSGHIEMAGATLGNEWAFENCIFKFEGRPDITDDSNKTAPVVGIGSGFSENGMFKNCVFENLQSEYNQAINVHDNEFMLLDITPYMLKGFTYVIDGCLFKSCNLIGMGSIHQAENHYDIDNILYLKQCSGIDTVNANENMKYKFIDN